MTPVKLALIGLGRMGRVHASALATLDLMDVVVVADPHPATPEHARKFFPRAETVSSYTDAVQRVEACLIVSPTPLHPEMVGAALDAGVHVLCEKPLALDSASAQRIAVMAIAARVPRSVRLAEAPSHGIAIRNYAPGTPGAESYARAAEEFAQRVFNTPVSVT